MAVFDWQHSICSGCVSFITFAVEFLFCCHMDGLPAVPGRRHLGYGALCSMGLHSELLSGFTGLAGAGGLGPGGKPSQGLKVRGSGGGPDSWPSSFRLGEKRIQKIRQEGKTTTVMFIVSMLNI